MAIDWDELFAYSTVKMVKIRDKKLGVLHYFFMLCILAYVVGYTVIYEKRYLLTESPVGSIRTSLLQGANVLPVEELPYCLYGNNTNVNGHTNYECLYWDENFVVFPETEESSMFATSRVTISSQDVNCSLINDYTCKYGTSTQDIYYIADIEHFTLLMDHTIYAPMLGIQANARDLPGDLLDHNSKVVSSLKKPNVVGVGSSDILELKTLFDSAGVSSLDATSGTNNTISLRYDGILLMVFLKYSNTYTYDTSKIKYTIEVAEIQNTKFKSVQPVFTKNYDNRVLWNRHGIRMIFIQEGELGKFDFQTLLLSFVSGLGLVTVSTVVVDLLAFYVLKPKKTYIAHKYEVTEAGDYETIGEVNSAYQKVPLK